MTTRPPAPDQATPSLLATGLGFTPRTDSDRCPGVLRLHEAADGALARVRVPGGLLPSGQVRALAGAADCVGDGRLHLTARGNVEIRAVRDAGRLAHVLDVAGLLPSTTHERVRNVVVSPLATFVRGAGRIDVVDLVRATDELIVAEPTLAALSGRFLFGFDDGRGDVVRLRPDLVFVADGSFGRVLAAGVDLGVQVSTSAASKVLVAAAAAFVEHGERHGERPWRIRESNDMTATLAAVRASVIAAGAVAGQDTPHPFEAERAVAARGVALDGPAPGVHPHGATHAVAASLVLGSSSAATWRALADAADDGDGLVRVTPWRGVVVAGLDTRTAGLTLDRLDTHGLVTRPDDPWLGVGACTGRPGCARARTDVHALAADVRDIRQRAPHSSAGLVYLSACERRCGRPTTAHLDVAARDEQHYTVTWFDDDAHEVGTARDIDARHVTDHLLAQSVPRVDPASAAESATREHRPARPLSGEGPQRG